MQIITKATTTTTRRRRSGRYFRPFFFLTILLQQFAIIPAAAAAARGRRVMATPNLPLGDINVVVVTDVHSWVGGHRDKEGDKYNADYGDVISFVEHLKAYGAENDKDVWFVMNGDWIDGTGLALNGDPSRLTPILMRMPWDALNVGNHELYDTSVIEFATKTGGLVEWFGKHYLSSNVLHTQSMEPLGHRYRILPGKNANVLTFGFLYNMQDHAEIVTVEDVESVVEQDWFIQVVSDTKSYDAVLVLAHMNVRDPLCQVILDKIRMLASDSMPVQFITGHTHRRDYEVFESNSASFEAGRFLDTVGFVSFPSIKSIKTRATAAAEDIATALNETKPPEADSLFKYKYMNAHTDVLSDALGISPEDFPTEHGVDQSEFILRIQTEMGLKQVIGCVSRNYFVNRTLDARDSLWGLFRDEVVPTMFSGDQVTLFGLDAFRYDLYTGEVHLDDALAISPFNNSLAKWEDVPAEVVAALNASLNAEPNNWMPQLPNYILASAEPLEFTNRLSTLIVDDFEKAFISDQLVQVWPNQTDLPAPTPFPALTTSSIWINYFSGPSGSCDTKGGGWHKKHGGTDHQSGGGSGGLSGFASPNPEADTARLVFVVVAVVAVAVLGSLAVWQKGTRFRYLSAEREQATMAALHEFEGEEGLYMDEEVEGEFT